MYNSIEKIIDTDIAFCMRCGPEYGILRLFLKSPETMSLQGDAKGNLKCTCWRGISYISYQEVLAICPALIDVSAKFQGQTQFDLPKVESGNWAILED